MATEQFSPRCWPQPMGSGVCDTHTPSTPPLEGQAGWPTPTGGQGQKTNLAQTWQFHHQYWSVLADTAQCAPPVPPIRQYWPVLVKPWLLEMLATSQYWPVLSSQVSNTPLSGYIFRYWPVLASTGKPAHATSHPQTAIWRMSPVLGSTGQHWIMGTGHFGSLRQYWPVLGSTVPRAHPALHPQTAIRLILAVYVSTGQYWTVLDNGHTKTPNP